MSDETVEAAPPGEERLARSALERYDLAPDCLCFVRAGENTTFRLRARERAFLVRVHSGTHTSAEQIESEGLLLEYLRSLEIGTFQAPLRNRDGEFATRVEQRNRERPVSVLEWIDAPLVGEHTADPSRFEQLGELMARLHGAFARWRIPDSFTRPEWNHRTLTSADGVLGFGTLGREVLGAEASAVVDDVEEKLRAFEASQSAVGDARQLIHADLHLRNALSRERELIPIDFDDCGWGSCVYELAVPLALQWSEPDYPSLAAGLLAGYRRRRELPAVCEELLPLYIAARCGFALLWMTGRGVALPALGRRARERAPRLLRTMADIAARY